MSPALDYDSLEKDYQTEILEHSEKASKQKKRLFRFIRFYIWLVGLVVALFLAFLILRASLTSSDDTNYGYNYGYGYGYGYREQQENSIDMSAIAVVLLSMVTSFGGVAFFVYALSKMKIQSFNTLRKLGIVQPFKNMRPAALNDILNDLTSKMGIDSQRVVLWKVLSPQAYPSVEQDDEGNINLVIPPHFLIAVRKEPAKAKAILAHELGHVLQKDTTLFLVTEAYFSVIQTIFIPLIITGILMRVYLMFVSTSAPFFKDNEWMYLGYCFDGGLLLFVIDGVSSIRESRKRSEVLADTAAVLYTRDDSIISVLEELSDQPGNSVHPSKQERLDYVKETFDEFKLA